MFSHHNQKEEKLITQHYEICKHYKAICNETSLKRAFAMMCFDL